MLQRARNFAFIDGNNLHMAVRDLGWRIDHKRFRVFLRERYQVEKAYYFVGFVEYNAGLYQHLQEAGFILIFKPTIKKPDGEVKGNVDAELVLYAAAKVIDDYDGAIIVTGDGDFHCLVEYLKEKDKLLHVMVPNDKFSKLLGRFTKDIVRVNRLRTQLEYSGNKKTRSSGRSKP